MHRWSHSHDRKEVWLCCSVKDQGIISHSEALFSLPLCLAAKTLPPNLKDVLSICVQVVNFIRGRPLHHRLFKLFCEKMGNIHQIFLFHKEVWWLCREKIFTCMAGLKDEIAIFL